MIKNIASTATIKPAILYTLTLSLNIKMPYKDASNNTPALFTGNTTEPSSPCCKARKSR
ncbi:MAG: hypothetical protein IPJ13_27180 [Saprospiraceae bacterium]|nr:hypothetical protein [Saprospiraceae bacterium]